MARIHTTSLLAQQIIIIIIIIEHWNALWLISQWLANILMWTLTLKKISGG